MANNMMTWGEWISSRKNQIQEKRMTDAKQEALRQALQFHASAYANACAGWPVRAKQAGPQDVVRTAAIFEKFLQAKSK
jgi:hypothetical protein